MGRTSYYFNQRLLQSFALILCHFSKFTASDYCHSLARKYSANQVSIQLAYVVKQGQKDLQKGPLLPTEADDRGRGLPLWSKEEVFMQMLLILKSKFYQLSKLYPSLHPLQLVVLQNSFLLAHIYHIPFEVGDHYKFSKNSLLRLGEAGIKNFKRAPTLKFVLGTLRTVSFRIDTAYQMPT